MEKWDAYDENFNIINNQTLIRGEEIPNGLFHLVCDIIVKYTDGTYLLMQRSPNKNYGGMWEATAGGSALKGESPLECAVRELREETGIVANEYEIDTYPDHIHVIFVFHGYLGVTFYSLQNHYFYINSCTHNNHPFIGF